MAQQRPTWWCSQRGPSRLPAVCVRGRLRGAERAVSHTPRFAATERFATIERENRILLSKMSEIMQKNTLDNKNKSIQYSHSLNKGYRQRELRRITNENQVRGAAVLQCALVWRPPGTRCRVARFVASSVPVYAVHLHCGPPRACPACAPWPVLVPR